MEAKRLRWNDIPGREELFLDELRLLAIVLPENICSIWIQAEIKVSIVEGLKQEKEKSVELLMARWVSITFWNFEDLQMHNKLYLFAKWYGCMTAGPILEIQSEILVSAALRRQFLPKRARGQQQTHNRSYPWDIWNHSGLILNPP